MNQIKVLLLLTIFAFAANTHAQTLNAYKEKLDKALKAEEYPTALNFYKIILDDAEKGDTKMYFDAAQLAHKLTVYEMAERYYMKVVESEDAATYPMANYKLGMVQKSLGKYATADSSFQRYVAASTSMDDEYVVKAKKEMDDCVWAQAELQKAKDIDLLRQDSTVNTSCYPEVAPFYHEGQLYFTSTRYEEIEGETSKERIQQIFSITEGGTAVRLTDGFNKMGVFTGHTAFSADGNRFFFTICEGEKVDSLRCHIYYKDKSDSGIWGEEVKLSDQINLDSFTTTQPNIGMDGDQELLFFTSDRPGGLGGKDIWCSARDANGEYGAPFNIQEVNTAEDEMTPFYHSATRILYFSSNGRQNMGGFDSYKIRQQGKSWGSVEHMGVPVNSSYDDVFYTVSDENGNAYFSSNRPATVCEDYPIDGPICSDIYSYEVPKVDLLALTYACGKELIECEVTLVDLDSGERFPVSTEYYNRAEYRLEFERNYMVIAQKDKYRGDTLRFNTIGLESDILLEKKLELVPFVDVTASMFNRLNSTDLEGCEVTLFNISLNKKVAVKTIAGQNRFAYTLAPGYRYRITATKDCYTPATALVSTEDPCSPKPFNLKLYLNPGFQNTRVVLFFDNDRPNPRTWDTTATVNYGQTFQRYMNRQSKFESALANYPIEQALISGFFRDSVQTGFDSLEQFTANLLKYMECNDDTKIEIILQGYASPLSQPSYNLNLTKRRVDCVEKYFEASGELGKYMQGDNSRITVKLVPNGDKKAIGGKNDRNDKVNSIYNVAASRERRVEIIRVDITPNN